VQNKKSLLLLVFLLLTLLLSVGLVLRITIFSGKATGTTSSSEVALGNSYLFASPLQAKADTKELVRITVFILDGRGLGVPNQPVKLDHPGSISLHEIQPTTDDTGKAVFDLSSPSTGKFEISASSNGKTLPQRVRVVFY
jgi:hypothetical protein